MKICHSKIFFTTLFIFLINLFTSAAFALDPIKPYDRIIFFGDSLSDNGNLYGFTLGYLPKSPPYFEGRFSNGPVWTDYVAHHFAKNKIKANNYAFGGLSVVLHNPKDGFHPHTLTSAMYDYLLHSAFRDRSTTLFVIWAGGNDYLKSPAFNASQLTSEVTEKIQYVVENLISHGGSQFLVINLPDLTILPGIRGSDRVPVLQAAVDMHNRKLATSMNEISTIYRDTNIHLFDVHAFFDDILKNLDATNKKNKTNIKNTVDACWQGNYRLHTALKQQEITEDSIQRDLDAYLNSKLKTQGLMTPQQKSLNTLGLARHILEEPDLLEAYKESQGIDKIDLGANACTAPDEYAFWDKIHPSAVVHLILARNMIKYIQQNYD